MKNEIIHTLTKNFEAHAKQAENGIEFWLARDLQELLGYDKWDNFVNVITKAKIACDTSGHVASNHFADVGKTIQMPKGAQKVIDDLMLTRYACYLIAQNGDPRKQEIAFAQTYFAMQTRRAELIEQQLLDTERVSARKKGAFSSYL
jgi:DNA-damage-inducible protein D